MFYRVKHDEAQPSGFRPDKRTCGKFFVVVVVGSGQQLNFLLTEERRFTLEQINGR